jgi:hypothetical protein
LVFPIDGSAGVADRPPSRIRKPPPNGLIGDAQNNRNGVAARVSIIVSSGTGVKA